MKNVTSRVVLGSYIANFKLGFVMMIRDKPDMISTAFIFIVLLMVFDGIFSVLPIQEIAGMHITNGHLLWYVSITEIIVMSSQGNERELGNQIADGHLTTMMQRPGNMMGLLLARVFGNAAAHVLLLSIVAVCLVPLCTNTSFPMQLIYLPLLIFAIVLSIILFILIGYITGTLEIHGPYSRPMNWITNKLIFTFGGLFFPVIFFPQFLQKAVLFTPFPATLGIAGNFMLIQNTGTLLAGIAQQILWIFLILQVAFWAERRMISHVLKNGD